MSSTPGDTLTTALAWHTAGASVVRAALDGTKRPLGTWKHHQTTRPDEGQLRAWFADRHPGIGLITGIVSSNLEMLEFEGRAVTEGVLAEYGQICDASGLGETWARLTTGYAEQTPSGGLHLLYRVVAGEVLPNTKLARRPSTEQELQAAPTDRVKPLIETRGEGGFVVVAPSHGPTHATGRAWALLAGGPATLPTLTGPERDALFQIARMLDQTPPPADLNSGRENFTDEVKGELDEAAAFLFGTQTPTPEGGTTPGDDYEARTDWADILRPHGWTLIHTTGRTRYWRRPGKDRGVSATTGRASDRDRLYVFTTSTEFTAETPYTKFGAYTVLHHAGDHHAAARALRRDGYGTPAPEPKRHPTPVPDPAPTDGTPLKMTEPQPGPETYTRTDDGNALRLVDTHEHTIRYVPQRGWLTWDGHHWTWDTSGTVHELARDIARALPAGEGDAQHRLRSLSARGLDAMVKVARTDPRIVAPIHTLDANPWQLNTPTGVADLRTGKLAPPDPAALHTRCTLVGPDFDAEAPRWQRFLMDTFDCDLELVAYVHRLFGLSLIGTVLEQILPFAFGEGANGKSTLADTIMRIVGIGETGYAISAPSEMLLASSANSHPTEIARLAGARLVVASELDDDQRFAEARIKMLTGRDIITGRFMRQDFFSFAPTHTLWLLGNHQPAVRTGGPAFWRRLRLVPFLHTIPKADQDPALEEKLVNEEGPAILAWLIRGAAAYNQLGLTTPAAVVTATEAYQGDQDTVARFVADMCTTGPATAQHMKVTSTAIRTAYETWCRAEGETPVSAKKFANELKKRHGVITERTMHARMYAGIRLNEDDAVPVDERW